MACSNCNRDTNDTKWGPWCDPCGGVHVNGKLFFRHVATVDGPGGRFPIVFDISTSDYAYMMRVVNPPSEKRDMDGFSRPLLAVAHGTLDAMIALSFPDAAGDGSRQPELSAAPSSTELERAIIESRI